MVIIIFEVSNCGLSGTEGTLDFKILVWQVVGQKVGVLRF